MGFGQRATKDREILREHVHDAAVDAPVSGHHTIAVNGRVGFVARGDKAVKFDERPFVKQHIEPLAGGEFAFRMLGCQSGSTAPLLRSIAGSG